MFLFQSKLGSLAVGSKKPKACFQQRRVKPGYPDNQPAKIHCSSLSTTFACEVNWFV
jgi:hypothetical protein